MEQPLTYRFADHDYEMRQLRVFQKMVERGLIYRQHRPVHYSPSSRSALAEAELEYKDAHVSHSVYVSFELDRESVMNPTLRDIIDHRPRTQLLVWTTTPWTLTANMVRPGALCCLLYRLNTPVGDCCEPRDGLYGYVIFTVS